MSVNLQFYGSMSSIFRITKTYGFSYTNNYSRVREIFTLIEHSMVVILDLKLMLNSLKGVRSHLQSTYAEKEDFYTPPP